MESNACHKAEHWDDEDSTSTVMQKDSFMIEWRINVFQDVTAFERAHSGHQVGDNYGDRDRDTSLKLETSSHTSFKLELRAAVFFLSTK